MKPSPSRKLLYARLHLVVMARMPLGAASHPLKYAAALTSLDTRVLKRLWATEVNRVDYETVEVVCYRFQCGLSDLFSLSYQPIQDLGSLSHPAIATEQHYERTPVLHCKLQKLWDSKQPGLDEAKTYSMLSQHCQVSREALRRLLQDKARRLDGNTVGLLAYYFDCQFSDLFELQEDLGHL